MIIKTKAINKQKELNIIRDKLNNNEKLSMMEAVLLLFLPLFDIDDTEEEIVEEVCGYLVDKKHCFPEDEHYNMKCAMLLNIYEYIDDEDKRDELVEMITMGNFVNIQEEYDNMVREEYRGEILNGEHEDLVNVFRDEGRDEVRAELIRELAKNFKASEIANFLSLDLTLIIDIIEN